MVFSTPRLLTAAEEKCIAVDGTITHLWFPASSGPLVPPGGHFPHSPQELLQIHTSPLSSPALPLASINRTSSSLRKDNSHELFQNFLLSPNLNVSLLTFNSCLKRRFLFPARLLFKAYDSEVRLPDLEFRLYPFFSVCPWANYSTPLYFSFSIFKMRNYNIS